MMVNCCGLLTANKAPVPLKSIEVELEVRDHVATVVSTLTYENKEDKPVEAVFVFPLPGDAAVCHFSAKIGQTQIVAEVKEKQQAREEYDDALSSGQQAFLLEESEQSPDIFTLSVGSLPPGESASIRLEYVTELAVQADDGLRFCLPAVLNPRYQPQGSGGSEGATPITALFQGQRSLVYAQCTGESSEAAQGCVTVKYSLAGHPSKNQLPFSLKPAEDTGLTVHRLGARTLIRSLEMEEREHRGQQDEGVKKKVVELSVQSGVSSSYTAFIVLNKGNRKPIQGPLVRRNIPTPVLLKARALPMIARRSCRGATLGRLHRKMGKPNLRGLLQLNSSSAVLASALDDEDIESTIPKQPCRDPLLQVVSLQNASGSWLLDPALADALGKTREQVDKSKPASVNQEVWATILALIWLHALKMDAKEEWELLAMKAVSWLRAQNAPSVADCVEAGNALLGCKVQEDVLGL
ncbi:von Willebrand factor A domain-containing protein 5A-like [Seriola dumerili]|uniref:von Willebrand factor A domain-containing protein 5A-like n=1 Tax=Seriola dumerili TaxID=41447 RepID=UPI000BBE4D70|nr:von Willebrand factor A domain-containing protein 5A-like [Seriola dumerili]